MPFATVEDVVVRLGRALTADEAAMAQQVIDSVTGQIIDTLKEDQEWADALDPVPVVFKTLCIEKVIAVGSNPQGLDSRTETLGAYSHTERYVGGEYVGAVLLTDEERRCIRRAVRDSTFAAVTYETPYSGTPADGEPTLPLP